MQASQATRQKTLRAIRSIAHGPLDGSKKPAEPDCGAKHGLRLNAIASDDERWCTRAKRPPCPGHDRQTPNRCGTRHTTRSNHPRAGRVGPAAVWPARLVAARSGGTKKLAQDTGLGSCGLKAFRPGPCAAQCGRWRPANRPHCRSPRGPRLQSAGRWPRSWLGLALLRWPEANSRVSSRLRCH